MYEEFAIDQVIKLVCEGDVTTVREVFEELFDIELKEREYRKSSGLSYAEQNKKNFLACNAFEAYEEGKRFADEHYSKSMGHYTTSLDRLENMITQLKWSGFDKLIKALEKEIKTLYKPTEPVHLDFDAWYEIRIKQLDDDIVFYAERDRIYKEEVDKHNKNRLALLEVCNEL
jgi:hypothetical protein